MAFAWHFTASGTRLRTSLAPVLQKASRERCCCHLARWKRRRLRSAVKSSSTRLTAALRKCDASAQRGHWPRVDAGKSSSDLIRFGLHRSRTLVTLDGESPCPRAFCDPIAKTSIHTGKNARLHGSPASLNENRVGLGANLHCVQATPGATTVFSVSRMFAHGKPGRSASFVQPKQVLRGRAGDWSSF